MSSQLHVTKGKIMSFKRPGKLIYIDAFFFAFVIIVESNFFVKIFVKLLGC